MKLFQLYLADNIELHPLDTLLMKVYFIAT
jgi:hypothetical protein